MTDHLPECRYVVFQQQGQIPEAVIPMGCICDRLRACEARARADEHRALITHGALTNLAGYSEGYAAGVAAARNAVAKLPMNGYHPIEVHNTVIDALAAIDALREKP